MLHVCVSAFFISVLCFVDEFIHLSTAQMNNLKEQTCYIFT